MNLFINAVSVNTSFLLFDNNRQIISREDVEVMGNESSRLSPLLDKFLQENKREYQDIENIAVVRGPGSFTGIRTICLMVNTINFVIKKSITPLSFFGMFNNYPIIKASSKRDVFIQKGENMAVEIIANIDLFHYIKENNITQVYGELPDGRDEGNIKVIDKIDYKSIIKELEFTNEEKIEPLYIKKPNIS